MIFFDDPRKILQERIPEGSVDLVILTRPMEQEVIPLLARVLKKGGKIIIVDPSDRPLLAQMIRNGCPPGGTVLDPFCSLGSVVLEEAERLRRRWIGIDSQGRNTALTL